MILTPIDPENLPALLADFSQRLSFDSMARAAFDLIAQTWERRNHADTPEHRAAAVDLAHRHGIQTLDEDPAEAFSWDGVCIRTQSEASVIVHEVAHWLTCAPERRSVYDFGLGAGPETGRREEADAARCVDDMTRQIEECLCSLLGILWEAELEQPAILAFLEQNWLEAHHRAGAVAHFADSVRALRQQGLIHDNGRPVWPKASKAQQPCEARLETRLIEKNA
ncbi:Elongation factor P hydroxylase [Azospirillaceae bacterium]